MNPIQPEGGDMSETIEPGYQAFVSDRGEEFGAVLRRRPTAAMSW